MFRTNSLMLGALVFASKWQCHISALMNANSLRQALPVTNGLSSFRRRLADMTDTSVPMAKTCDICKEKYIGFSNNAWPLIADGLCCDDCNSRVLMARIANMRKLSKLSDEDMGK